MGSFGYLTADGGEPASLELHGSVQVPGTAVAAAWLRPRLASAGLEACPLDAIIPAGFEAYARVFHPAYDLDGSPVAWSEVAAAHGRVMHRQAQWEAIIGPPALQPEDSWATKASMPTARYYPTSTAVNGKTYTIGGVGGTSTVKEFDPVTNTWTNCGGTCASMPTARTALSSSVVNGRIYAIGGWSPALATVEEYTPPAP